MELSVIYDRNKKNFLSLKEYNKNHTYIQISHIGGNPNNKSLQTKTDTPMNFRVDRNESGKFTKGPNSYLLKEIANISGRSGDHAYIVSDVTETDDEKKAPKYVL